MMLAWMPITVSASALCNSFRSRTYLQVTSILQHRPLKNLGEHLSVIFRLLFLLAVEKVGIAKRRQNNVYICVISSIHHYRETPLYRSFPWPG